MEGGREGVREGERGEREREREHKIAGNWNTHSSRQSQPRSYYVEELQWVATH
jgi:hypothetical protein